MIRPDLPFISVLSDAIILNVYVQPRSSKNQICGIVGTELKVRLTSPPVDGAANKLCRGYFADLFRISNSSVAIITGETSRHKRLKISVSNPDQLEFYLSALADALGSGHSS